MESLQPERLITMLINKGKTFGLVCLLLLISCGQRERQNPLAVSLTEDQEEFVSKIELLVQDYINLDIFSGVVLVAEKGKNIFHKAYGLSDRSTAKPNDLNTLFDIGSMNKTFTKIVVKQLVEEGKLKLTDKLVDFVPDFSDKRVDSITIEHLLEHQSGFGDYHSEGYFQLPLKERTLEAIVERARKSELFFSPGTDESYSNLGYVILGKIIEVASGQSYFSNVQERIVDRLKLSNTYLNNFDGLEERIAKGYYFTPLGNLEENSPIQDVPNPDGGFLSTTEDIKIFYHSYLYDTALLSEKTKEADPYFQFLNDLPEGGATGAAGGFEGFNSVIFQVYDKDLSIIVFANMDEPVSERLASDILSLYRGEMPEKPALPAIQNVRINLEKHGIEYIRNNFEKLIENFHPTDPKDIIINDLGYAYLYGADDLETAIKLFSCKYRIMEWSVAYPLGAVFKRSPFNSPNSLFQDFFSTMSLNSLPL